MGLNPQNDRMPLTLAEALRSDRLSEFVAQQEAAGLLPANPRAFDQVIRAAIIADRVHRLAQFCNQTGAVDRRRKRIGNEGVSWS
jgi:hypothetical protein